MELSEKRIAVLAEDLYEELELWYPFYRMKEAGAEVRILGTGRPEYHGKHGLPVHADMRVEEAAVDDFDAVVIPGGYSPDRMRRHAPLVEFVRAMSEAGKLVAFICHAGWVPISAGIVEGHEVTSFPSIQDDLRNAGAAWLDREVVRDGNLISSRSPADLPAFCRTIIEVLCAG